MKQPMLDLPPGKGEPPRRSEQHDGVVFDPTPEEIAEMDDAWLFDVYGAMVEYDASGGRVRRRLRRELDRREMTKDSPASS